MVLGIIHDFLPLIETWPFLFLLNIILNKVFQYGDSTVLLQWAFVKSNFDGFKSQKHRSSCFFGLLEISPTLRNPYVWLWLCSSTSRIPRAPNWVCVYSYSRNKYFVNVYKLITINQFQYTRTFHDVWFANWYKNNLMMDVKCHFSPTRLALGF